MWGLSQIWCGFCGRNVDDVHILMDDVAEQQEIANEISDAISNPVGFQQDVDEVSINLWTTYSLLAGVGWVQNDARLKLMEK